MRSPPILVTWIDTGLAPAEDRCTSTRPPVATDCGQQYPVTVSNAIARHYAPSRRADTGAVQVRSVACGIVPRNDPMRAEPPAVELVDRPALGRTVTRSRPVRLGDVDERGRLRFDAIARYLQDIATDDSSSAELDDSFGWIVRRTLVDVRRAAGLGESLELTTFCSGTGRSWAERRTSITGAQGASIETASLWIRVDPTSGRPTGLDERFLSVYGSAANDRKVSTRLRLPPPPADVERDPWPVRRVDLDPLRHVNNAAQWAIVEQTLPAGSRRGRAEIEHLSPVEPDTPLVLANYIGADGSSSSWLLADGAVLTAARWRPASASSSLSE